MFRYLPASPNDDLLRTPDMLRRREEHLRRILGTLLVAVAYSSLLFIRCLPDIKRTETLWLWALGERASEAIYLISKAVLMALIQVSPERIATPVT